MTSAHLIAASIGIILSLGIIVLVRRDHLTPHVAARWFLVSLVVLFLSLTPDFTDYIGAQLGVAYPPILLVLVAISCALIKILVMDIERQKMQTRLDRLVQKLSIVEEELERLKCPSETSQAQVVRMPDKISRLK